VPKAGVPLSTPAALKVTPLGRVPISLKAGAGKPVAVAVKDPGEFTVNEALFALVIAGAWPTVRVKPWLAFGETPLLAVIVMAKFPVTVGVPLSTPAEVKVTPLGRAPISLKVGAGNPVAVTVKEPAVFTTNVVLFALVMAGAWFTVRVKLCVASGETPLLAVIVIAYVPPEPAAGVPLSTPAELSVTPPGSAPVLLKVGAGKPVAVTLNDPGVPTWKVALLPLVMAGAWFTVWATPADVLVWKLPSPAYVAVSVFAPEVVGVSWQVPAETAAVQLSPVPSLTVTFPVGVPAPGELTATVKLTVTACPVKDGLGVWPVIVVVVPAGLTVCATPVDVLPV
jgi:hypothetical protein